jgi:GntR family transcriptional regulator
VPSIRFRLSARSHVPPFRQLVEQVSDAVRDGRLLPGDRLPSVREVVTQIAINPNTVHRAYRELEHLGVTEARPGLGTYISSEVMESDDIRNGISSSRILGSWVEQAREAGLTDDEILKLVRRLLIDSNESDSISSVITQREKAR